MNIPTFLRNLRRNVLPTEDELYTDAAAVAEKQCRAIGATVPLPAPPPEPSCFAKGIARSIVEEAEKWEVPAPKDCLFQPSFNVVHRDTGVCIWTPIFVDGERLPGTHHFHTIHVDPSPLLNRTDLSHIALAIEAHPIGQLKAQIEAERVETERKARAEAHFTALGCPESK